MATCDRPPTIIGDNKFLSDIFVHSFLSIIGMINLGILLYVILEPFSSLAIFIFAAHFVFSSIMLLGLKHHAPCLLGPNIVFKIFLITYIILFGLTTKEESLSAELSYLDVWIGLTAFWYTVELHVIFATLFRIYTNNRGRVKPPPSYEKVVEMDKRAKKSKPPSYDESQSVYTIYPFSNVQRPALPSVEDCQADCSSSIV